ncbi:MAG: S1 RNA-binding domain-containing protein [Thermoanaerobaculia bacterium]
MSENVTRPDAPDAIEEVSSAANATPAPASVAIEAAAEPSAEPAAATGGTVATAPSSEETAPAAAAAVEGETDAADDAVTGEATAAAAPPADGAKKGGEKKAKSGKARTRAKRPAGRRNEDQFVKPTPEELALVPSDIVKAAIENEAPVSGTIIGWNQGGFHVVVDGITGFCPRSSMELGAPKEPAQYLDQSYLFRVLRVEEKGHRLVVSRAAVLRDERAHLTAELRKSLTLGSVVKGKVISITDFGAFVDLGGVEGLLHVSEIRRTRVEHANEVLKVGDEIEAKIVKLPKGSERISLSMKALEPDPWQGIAERFPNGGRFSGKVMRKSDFGWFVELEPGVEGLLHVSQLAPGMKADDPKLAAGETIEGWVREVDVQRNRLSLALREMPQGNPWEGVEKKYPEGSKITGTVEKVEKFGAFILLEPGLTGLLPASEMGLPKGANIGRTYGVGKQVKLQVAQVDARKKRISLTIEGKTLEGSKSDYQSYLKQSRKSTGLGAMASALARLRQGE